MIPQYRKNSNEFQNFFLKMSSLEYLSLLYSDKGQKMVYNKHGSDQMRYIILYLIKLDDPMLD